MTRYTRVMVVAVALWGCGPPVPPAGPGGGDVPDGLPGLWKSEPLGLTLDLRPDGSFDWRQGDLHKQGSYHVQGKALVMVVDKRYPTSYSILELSPGRLVIQDPAGTQVVLTGQAEPAAAGGGEPGLVHGVWTNVAFAVRIELAQDGTFVWRQGDLVETGTWRLESGTIHMSTGGHTSAYRLVSVSETAMVLVDPAGNELPLDRAGKKAAASSSKPLGKDSLLAGAPPIKIVDLGSGSGGPGLAGKKSGKEPSPSSDSIVGAGGIFFFTPPSGWKVDTQKVCGNKFTAAGKKYTCWRRNDLFAKDSSRVHFEIASFVTWAAPGALEELSPDIDALLGAYDEDRTSVSDDIDEMAGFELFSTRIDGRASGGARQLKGRIVGIHFGDLLVVGVLALSADTETLAAWGSEIDAALDSMAFHFPQSPDLVSSLQGSWESGDGTTWTFWSDGTYLKGQEAGSWAVHGSTLLMAVDPQGEGKVTAGPVRVEGDMLAFGETVLEKK